MPTDSTEGLKCALTEVTRKKLAAYALKLVRGHDWPGETDPVELSKDIASEAICKAITGVRRWDTEVTPSPIDFLFSAVKSTVSAYVRNDRNSRNLESLDELEEDFIHDCRHSPHTIAESEEFLLGLLEEVGDDEVCADMIDLFDKGYKPEEMAEKLDLTKEEIYAAKKRLQRIATAYLKRTQGLPNNGK